MKDYIKNIRRPAILITVLLTIIIFISCNPGTEEAVEKRVLGKDEPIQELWPFNMELTKNGKVSVYITSDYMALYDRDIERVIIGSVKAKFFDAEGNISSVLTADSSYWNRRTNIYTARSNVVVEADTGTLYTEEFHFNRASDLLFTEVYFTFISKGDTINGEWFESDNRLENYHIKKAKGSIVKK